MANFTDVNKIQNSMIMRDLNKFRDAVEDNVTLFLDNYCDENEYVDEDIEVEFELDGVSYSAIVNVTARFCFSPVYEYDIYNIPYYQGDEVNLENSDFSIKDLWDDEIEDYIITDYKQTDKW